MMMSAPNVSAATRRHLEKSAAITGPQPCAFNAAITARPTGPHPMTRATDLGSIRALATACRPTAKGSVRTAWSVARPFGTSSTRVSQRRICSEKLPGRRLEKPSISTRPAVRVKGTLTTRDPALSPLVEPGP